MNTLRSGLSIDTLQHNSFSNLFFRKLQTLISLQMFSAIYVLHEKNIEKITLKIKQEILINYSRECLKFHVGMR